MSVFFIGDAVPKVKLLPAVGSPSRITGRILQRLPLPGGPLPKALAFRLTGRLDRRLGSRQRSVGRSCWQVCKSDLSELPNVSLLARLSSSNAQAE